MQQIKVDQGISFPDARKAALSEQSTNTSSKRTAASVISGTTTVTSQRSQNQRYLSLNKLNLLGHREPISLCQSKQIAKQRKPIAIRIVQKNRNTTCPSPPPRSSRGANAPIPSTSKVGQGDPQPPPSSSSSKKRQTKNKPSPSTHR